MEPDAARSRLMEPMDELTGGLAGDSEDGLISPEGGVDHPSGFGVMSGAENSPGVDVHDHLWWYSDGALWDLGPAEFDANGDGVRDSLTCEVDGSPAIVADTDGDGRVDRVSILQTDCRVDSGALGEHDAEWSPTTLGRLE